MRNRRDGHVGGLVLGKQPNPAYLSQYKAFVLDTPRRQSGQLPSKSSGNFSLGFEKCATRIVHQNEDRTAGDMRPCAASASEWISGQVFRLQQKRVRMQAENSESVDCCAESVHQDQDLRGDQPHRSAPDQRHLLVHRCGPSSATLSEQ